LIIYLLTDSKSDSLNKVAAHLTTVKQAFHRGNWDDSNCPDNCILSFRV